MKCFFILLTCFALENVACKKDKSNSARCDNVLTITKVATLCNTWGIQDGNSIYPSANIPDQFKQEGLAVCATYSIYIDMRLCACCGGTWADIESMSPAN